MTTLPAPCVFCDGPATMWHHPTARVTPVGPYVDRHFVVPVCVPCHYAEHAAWHDIGLDVVGDPTEARSRRIIWLLGRLADRGRPVLFPERTLRGFHLSVMAMAGELDATR